MLYPVPTENFKSPRKITTTKAKKEGRDFHFRREEGSESFHLLIEKMRVGVLIFGKRSRARVLIFGGRKARTVIQ